MSRTHDGDGANTRVSRPASFDLDHDVHGHPYLCSNKRNDGTPCGVPMRRVARGDYWELSTAEGVSPYEEIAWVSRWWSLPENRANLERYRRDAGQPPLPPGPVTNYDIPDFARMVRAGFYSTLRSHRFECPDPSAPVLRPAPVPECCDFPMRHAPRGWVCRRNSDHVHLFTSS